MSNEKVIEVLRSGNFTVIYHDNGEGSIYQGKLDDFDTVQKKNRILDFDTNNSHGYAPYIVQLLVQALTGKTLSI